MRLAFIGGNGHHYLRNLIGEMPLEVAVAGDGFDADAARRWSSRVPGAQWFETPQQLFDEFLPQVVSVGAVYGHNGEVIASALERDIRVVSDKPVAASWEQLERLRELLANGSRALLTEFPFRAQSEFRAAKEAVARGDVGEVVLATAQKSYRFGAARPAWYGRREDYGGTMLWVASHGIDVVRFCSGQEFSRVVGAQNNLSKREYAEMEDHCAAMFTLENGGTALVHADFLRPQSAPSHGDDRLRIAGSRGVLEVRDDRCVLIAQDAPPQDITDSVSVRPVHQELWAALHGDSAFYSTQESLRTAEILLKARDAADRKEWQDV